jgi:hypothetical protein
VNQPVTSARPILGALSILLPAFGAGLWLFFAKNPHLGNALNGYASLFIFFALLFVSGGLVLGGIACATAGLMRRERFRFLAVIGLLGNLAIILFFKR